MIPHAVPTVVQLLVPCFVLLAFVTARPAQGATSLEPERATATAAREGSEKSTEETRGARRTDLRLGTQTGQPRVISIEDALESTRRNNITWKSLEESLYQARIAKKIGWAMMMPKLQAEAQWFHIDEVNYPEFDSSGSDSLSTMVELLGTLTGVVLRQHPESIPEFTPYLQDAMEEESSSSSKNGKPSDDPFAAFAPVQDTLSATFSLVVPVLSPQSIAFVRASRDQYASAVQRVGHGREQLLYTVAKSYYTLYSLQAMKGVSESSLESARKHFENNQLRAKLKAATQLDVKRSELEIAKSESQLLELVAGLESGKAMFRYLTGIKGDFLVDEPSLELPESDKPLEHWVARANAQREDLLAARLDVLAARHEIEKSAAKYLPELSLFGQVKADNAQEQRFDDDPYSLVAGASVSMNIFDGGLREAEIRISRSQMRQTILAQEDLERSIRMEVESAYSRLNQAAAARRAAKRQLEVARATFELAEVSAEAGVVTNLEVIDAHAMVSASEAQYVGARLTEAMSTMDLLAAAGFPVPWQLP